MVALDACTFAPPESVVTVANHVHRPGTDSVALALHAVVLRRPTGLAAFPDGGTARREHERGIFYLCVAGEGQEAAVLQRIAVVPRPDSLRAAFTPWLSSWDGPASVVASVRGYADSQSRPEAARTVWFRVRLTGELEPLAAGPEVLGPATPLPSACEAAARADARALLARLSAPPR